MKKFFAWLSRTFQDLLSKKVPIDALPDPASLPDPPPPVEEEEDAPELPPCTTPPDQPAGVGPEDSYVGSLDLDDILDEDGNPR